MSDQVVCVQRGTSLAFKIDMQSSNDIVSPREVSVVINLRSRSGPRAAERALKELELQGVRIAEHHLVRHGHQMEEAVREVIERGARTVVIGGGDGTISAVVDLFANKQELTLGVLPVGTGNEVARMLGIPLDLPGACRVIAQGQVATVDLAEANGNFFIHTALIGYPAHANHAIPSWLKLHFGKAAYAYSLLASLVGAKPFRVTISEGANRWTGKTILVVVGNDQFHLPAHILLPRSKAPGRGLSAYAPRDTRLSTILRLVIGLWITHQRQPALLISLTGDSIEVIADPRQDVDVDVDGEYCCLTPTRFHLARDALKVIIPTSSGYAKNAQPINPGGDQLPS